MAHPEYKHADIAALEANNKIPLGWLIFYFSLIAWGIYYVVSFTPAISGWTQDQDLKAAMAAEEEAAEAAEAGAPDAKKAIGPDTANPLAGDADAIAEGKAIYEEVCEECHDSEGVGDMGPALNDKEFLYVDKDVPDGTYFLMVQDGTEDGFALEGYEPEGGMPGYGNQYDTDKIWSVIAYIRSLQP